MAAAMAQRWYIGNGESVDVLDDSTVEGMADQNVRGARGVREQMYQHEAELHHEVQERVPLTDDANREKTSNDGLHTGIRSIPVLLEQSRTVSEAGNLHSLDPTVIYDEDKLGCARGMVWGFVFEAGVIIAIAILWKLRFGLR
jgi:hypothetical protein